jgi:O-antigen ligase
MPEHLKALLVILVLGGAVLFVSASAAREVGICEGDFARRRNMWLALTLLAFLSGGFWTYIIFGFIASWIAARREQNPIALYVLLLFAAPPLEKQILGFGPIDHFFSINHYRMLNLAVLLPVGLRLLRPRRTDRPARITDWLVLAFLLLQAVIHLFTDSASGAARAIFYSVVDILVPYLVASRTLTSVSKIAETVFSFVVAALICSLISIFENTRFWLLYESLRGPFGIPGDPWVYLLRGEGVLRSKGSVGNSIALGYAIMVGVAALTALRNRVQRPWMSRVAIALFVGGLACTVSRGPWVGAVAAVATVVVLGPNLSKKLAASLVATALATLFFAATPLGQKLAQYLPFVGGVETGSIDYRERLLDTSIDVLLQNPILGDIHYLSNPMMQSLRQGQGIIDMVNTYLQVAMPYGIAGLFLFLAIFFSAMWCANRTRIRTSLPGGEALGRGILAMLVGIMVTIFTVSSITIISPIYWLVIAIAVAYSRIDAGAETSGIMPAPIATKRTAGRRRHSTAS